VRTPCCATSRCLIFSLVAVADAFRQSDREAIQVLIPFGQDQGRPLVTQGLDGIVADCRLRLSSSDDDTDGGAFNPCA
jgi:hypothetical protein